MNAPLPTILLIHGLWVTPSSWDPFRHRFEQRGHRVLAPAWPGISSDVAEMRRDPSGLHGVGIEEVVAHYAGIIHGLPAPPIIIGHSFGGLITQLLADRGLGGAAVAINSVPPKGVLPLPWTTIRALLPVLLRPGLRRRTFAFTFAQFWRDFANTLDQAEAQAAFAREIIPASSRAIFQSALANLTPQASSTVDFTNRNRPPLLLIAGESDVIIPAVLNRRNFHRYAASTSVTAFKEFPGRSHFIIGEVGWEEVADHALTWAVFWISERGESAWGVPGKETGPA